MYIKTNTYTRIPEEQKERNNKKLAKNFIASCQQIQKLIRQYCMCCVGFFVTIVEHHITDTYIQRQIVMYINMNICICTINTYIVVKYVYMQEYVCVLYLYYFMCCLEVLEYVFIYKCWCIYICRI